MRLSACVSRLSALQFSGWQRYGLGLLVVTWFTVILGGLWWLLEARLVWFDGQGQLQQQLSSSGYEQRLTTQLQQVEPNMRSTVFHVVAEGCACNWRTRGHQQSIMRSVSAQGGRNIRIDIDQYPQLKTLLPSTPAVIIFNASQQLVYLGPYADGAFCNTETSFVEQLLPAVTSADSAAAGGWINTVAKGCYCSVAI